MQHSPPYTDCRTLADQLGVCVRTVQRHVHEGDWPHVRIGPVPAPGRRDVRPLRFTPAQVEQIKATYLHVDIIDPATARESA